MVFWSIFIALFYIILKVSAEWKKFTLSGTVPENLIFHESVEYTNSSGGEEILLFGGYFSSSDSLNQNVYSIDVSTKVVTQVTVSGTPMQGRVKFASCSIINGGKTYVYLHGGYCAKDFSTYCQDFYVYDVTAKSFTSITTNLFRAEHSIVCDTQNKYIWLFGGLTSTGPMNDLWYYNINTPGWVQAKYSLFQNIDITITLWDNTKEVFTITDYQDYISIPSSELSKLSPGTKNMLPYSGTYDCITTNMLIPTCRSNYTFLKKSGELFLYIIGGLDKSNSVVQDIWTYDIVNEIWAQVIDTIPSSYTAFFSKQKARFTVGESFIMFFGGFDGSNYSTDGFARSFSNGKISKIQIPQFQSIAPTKKIGISVNSFSTGITMVGGCENENMKSTACQSVGKLSFYLMGINDCDSSSLHYDTTNCFYGRHICIGDFWGDTCKQELCPGSMCLFDINSFEKPFCYECFGNGKFFTVYIGVNQKRKNQLTIKVFVVMVCAQNVAQHKLIQILYILAPQNRIVQPQTARINVITKVLAKYTIQLVLVTVSNQQEETIVARYFVQMTVQIVENANLMEIVSAVIIKKEQIAAYKLQDFQVEERKNIIKIDRKKIITNRGTT